MDYQVAMQEETLRRGSWLEEEDERLISIVALSGERRWDSLAKASGLRRNGKSCRLRWMNYLRPNLKHGRITKEEEQKIMQLHEQWGNKWSRIARRLPGRTDNEIKNYWRSHLRKKAEAREQGPNFECAINNAKQDLMDPKCESVFENTDENISSADSSYINAFELSNFGFASSPYESRVSDFVSHLSSDHESLMKCHQGDFCSLDSCFCYLSWISSEDCSDSSSMWDSSGSLWDMD